MEIVLIILQFLILAALLVGIFLLKNYLPSYFSEKGKNLATKEDIAEITHEIEAVKDQYVQQTEQLRHQLRLSAFQHETRFARVYEKRAEVLFELYKRLGRAKKSAELFALKRSDPETEKAATLANEGLAQYFSEVRLYLPKSLQEQLVGVGNLLITTVIDVSNAERKNSFDEWQIAWKRLRDEIDPAMEKIEAEMRVILGESDDGKSA